MALDTALEWAPARDLLLYSEVDIPTPDVPEHLHWIWRAFHRLDFDRGWIGGGIAAPIPGRIPWRSIVEWAQFYELDREDYVLLDACIIAMDSVYLAHHRKMAAQ